MDFWSNVKEILDNRKISQLKFAEDIGIPVKTVQNYFYRKTLPDILLGKKICDYLNVTLETLIGETEKEYLVISDKNEIKIISDYRSVPDSLKGTYISLGESLMKAGV